MKTTLASRLNTAIWIGTGLSLVITLIHGVHADQFTTHLIAALFWVAVYYLFFLYMAPVFLLQKKLIGFFAISLLILLMLPFIGYTLLLLSKAMFTGNFADFYGIYSFDMHMSGFKAMIMAGVFGSFFRLIAEHFRN